MKSQPWTKPQESRRAFIGGSDARIIMGDDEAGPAPPLAGEARRGRARGPVRQSDRPARGRDRAPQPALVRAQYRPGRDRGAAAGVPPRQTLDGGDHRRHGRGDGRGVRGQVHAAVDFSEEAAAEKHMAQLQHNMWVTASRTAVLSIITGGGKWVEMTIPADPLYQHLLLTAEKKFWRCVESGETPRLFGVEPPRPRVEAVRTVDMSGSNAWAEFADLYRLTRAAALDHDRAKAELKALVPEDAKEAVRARRAGQALKIRRHQL